MRRRAALALLLSALIASCLPHRIPATDPLPPPSDVPAEPAPSPWPDPPPPATPDAPGYAGPGDACPYMKDFCREQFIYETSLEGSHAPPSSGPRGVRGGASRSPASRS